MVRLVIETPSRPLFRHCNVKSLQSRGAYMHQWTMSPLLHIFVCYLLVAKPLPHHVVVTYFQLDLVKIYENFVKFESK